MRYSVYRLRRRLLTGKRDTCAWLVLGGTATARWKTLPTVTALAK